jgi:hypothetical protein
MKTKTILFVACLLAWAAFADVSRASQDQPLTERMPYLLPAFLIAAGLILLWMVYRFLKK